MSKVLEALVDIQANLKAPKDQKANRYRYRNIEDINEAVKPLAAKHGCAVAYTDEIVDGVCVSTCRLICEDGQLSAQGAAMVNRSPQHMSIEQSSGAASSYARKYAAQGLFAIDSSENDPDRTEGGTKGAPAATEDSRGDAGALEAAKQRLWRAVQEHAARTGGDAKKLAEGCRKRSDYQETAEWYRAVAYEFETQ